MRATTFGTYQVRVEVRGETYEYYARYGKRISHTVIKMFHFDRRTPQQAIDEGAKHGKVISCCKVDYEVIAGNPENTQIDQHTIYDRPLNAVTLDEQIWKKRNIRRANLQKDKVDIDKNVDV